MFARMMILLPVVFAIGCADAGKSPVTPAESAHAAQLAEYVAVDLGAPADGESVATGITGSGVIVGTATGADGLPHAFRWTARTGFENLAGLLDAVCSGAMDVNNGGEVVGWRRSAADGAVGCTGHGMSAPRPFRLTAEGSLIMASGGMRAPAVAINDGGDVLVSFVFWNYFWASDLSETQICPSYDLDLRTLTNSGAAYGSAWASPVSGWGAMRWTTAQPSCVDLLHTDTYAPFRLHDVSESGTQIGIGYGIEADAFMPGGFRATTPMQGYSRHPSSGYRALDFTPYAVNERGDIVGAQGNLAVLQTKDGYVVSLGSGRALAINNSGDVVGVSGDGRAVLWTRRPDTFPGGARLLVTSSRSLGSIARREAASLCTGRHALLAAMNAFPECPAPELSRGSRGEGARH